MKTILPASIRSIEEAKLFLTQLVENGERYHPEDDAHEINWSIPVEQQPTKPECDLLNKLMNDIYHLEGNAGNYPNLAFDPCEFLREIETK